MQNKKFHKQLDNTDIMSPADENHTTRDSVDDFILLDQRHKVKIQTKNLRQMKNDYFAIGCVI